MQNNRKVRLKFLLIVFILGSIIIILYWRYLTGEYLFLFPNVVNDGVTQFLPRYLKLARLYSDEGRISTYTLSDGFGEWMGIGSPFDIFIIMFGEQNVPYLIGVKEAICIFLAGMLMSIFLMETGCSFSTCMLGGVVYSLSYQLVIGSCWSNQAEMAITIVLFLLVAEKTFHRKYIWGVAGIICLFLFKTCFGIYQLLLYGSLCAVYLAIRLGIGVVKSNRVTFRKLGIVYGTVVVFGSVLLLFLLKDKLCTIFGSDRFLNGLGTWGTEWKNTLSLLNFQNIVTAYYRTLAPNIMGISWLDDYHGMPMQSCLDDGGFYITILAIYSTVILLDRRNRCKGRSPGILALGAIAVMVCFPGIRLFINGFVNVTYKLSRLWMILFFAGIMLCAWQEIMANGKDVYLKPLMMTAVLVSISLILPMTLSEGYLYAREAFPVLFFLWGYLVLFFLWQKYPLKRSRIRYVFLLVCCIEGISLNYSFVNSRDALKPEDLVGGYYNDGTEEAVKRIHEHEEGIYRINKSYQSVMLCDSLAQDYLSTTFYHGGVDDAKMTSFIKIFSLPTMCNKMGYLTGTYGYSALSSVLGVKYNIMSENHCIENGYHYIEEVGKKNIYVNENALPLVFGYETVITEDDFWSYSLNERHDAITQGCFVDRETYLRLQNGIKRGKQHIKDRDVEPVRRYVYEEYKIAEPLEFDTLSEREIAVVKVRDKEDKCVNLYWKTEDEGWYNQNTRTMSVYPVNGESFIELAGQKGLQGIIFYGFDDKVIESLDEVIIEVYRQKEYSKLLDETVSELQCNSIVYECSTEQLISGKLIMKNDGIIFISLPYSAPYVYYVNGQKAETICVNGLFTGIEVNSGVYEVAIEKTEPD
ncbi:MAG: YfhO family protein [Lachnospiraceae bacterium]|nr:YfhO family protein [Lachnospiraceae bacterium]